MRDEGRDARQSGCPDRSLNLMQPRRPVTSQTGTPRERVKRLQLLTTRLPLETPSRQQGGLDATPFPIETACWHYHPRPQALRSFEHDG